MPRSQKKEKIFLFPERWGITLLLSIMLCAKSAPLLADTNIWATGDADKNLDQKLIKKRFRLCTNKKKLILL